MNVTTEKKSIAITPHYGQVTLKWEHYNSCDFYTFIRVWKNKSEFKSSSQPFSVMANLRYFVIDVLIMTIMCVLPLK